MPRKKPQETKFAGISEQFEDMADSFVASNGGDEVQSVGLGYVPRPWQTKVHRRKKRFTVLVCHRRAGKTILAILELIDCALSLALKNGRFAYIAPLKNQAKDIAWDYLKEYASKIPNTYINETESYVQFKLKQPDGTFLEPRIKIYGADNIHSLRGRAFDGIVVDEVADIKIDAWGEILRPCLADRKGWALFLGTPKGVNLLSQLYFRAIGAEKIAGDNTAQDNWLGLVFTVDDTKAIDAGELASIKADLTDSQYKQEFLCDFNAGSEDSLVSLYDLEAAVARSRTTEEFCKNRLMPVVMGVDVARKGPDSSCICVRQGNEIRFLKRYRNVDEMELVLEVMRVSKEFGADAVFVDGTGGYGGGVVETLIRFGVNAVDIQFGSRTQLRDKKFLNKRCEMYWDAAMWIKRSGCLPDDPLLKKEFSAVKYWHNGANMLQISSKDEIKATGIGSPDSADAVVLTFAFDVPVSYSSNTTSYGELMAKGYGFCSALESNEGQRKYGASMRF